MAPPLKVVHVITGLKIGGAEMTLCRMLTAFDRRRLDCCVISLTEGGALEADLAARAIPVFHLAMTSGRPTLRGLWQLVRLLRRLRPDVVQGWLYQGNLAALAGQVLALPKVPLVWNIRHSLDDLEHESVPITRAIAMGRRFSRRASCIVFNSAQSVRQHQAHGYAAQRTVLIPNGFDGAKFRPSSTARERIRQSLGLANEEVAIGLVARFHPVKGHDVFFQAAARLSAEYPTVRWVLAGAGIDPENRELMRQIAQQGLTGRVILCGERHDLPDFWNCLDIATLSSHAEGFPNALGEAMACGIPCVTTDVGDAAMIVGSTGMVVPSRDPAAFAGAIMKMVDLGPEGRALLGSAARTRVLENFSFAKTVDQYEELYHSLCRQPGNGA